MKYLKIDDNWVGFKERYLKKVNTFLSKNRDDVFKRRKKRTSIYFNLTPDLENPDGDLFDTLDKLGAFASPGASPQKKKDTKLPKDNNSNEIGAFSRFSSYGQSNVETQFKESKSPFGTNIPEEEIDDFKVVKDNIDFSDDDGSGDEQEEHEEEQLREIDEIVKESQSNVAEIGKAIEILTEEDIDEEINAEEQ